MKGGLKLKDPSKTGFNAIYEMLNRPSAVLKLMTYSSLKGFIVTLDVDPSDSEYLNVDVNGRFTDPVTSFLLKFAVITPQNDTSLETFVGPRGTKDKASESADSYFEEAKLQNKIWKKSIAGGRPEICPPIANFSLFNVRNSKLLLQFLYSKSNDNDTRSVFRYLLKVNNTVRNGKKENALGVIVMPKVESETLADIMEINTVQDTYDPINAHSKEILDAVCACVTAQTVRLFIDIGVIHFDLHAGNSLISKSNSNCVLIDFGRASSILTDEEDDYFDVDEKEEMKQKKEEFYNKFFQIEANSTGANSSTRLTRTTMACNEPIPKCKADFILDVMNFLIEKDREKNELMFPGYKGYQMSWFEYFKDDPNSLVPVKAFDILKDLIPVRGKGITPATIQQYEKQGIFVNFSLPLDDFIVSFPGPTPPPAQPCEGFGCVISGGRRKRTKKQLRKYRKSRKQRKSKTRRRR